MQILGNEQAGALLEVSDDAHADELVSFLVLVVVAGNETTRNAMGGGMRALSQNPGEWQRLVADPSLWATATDEIIRWVSPVMNFARNATCDTELGGQQIKAGDKVFMLYQSANRDDAVFDAPDEFRVDHESNEHMAFGIGPHHRVAPGGVHAGVTTRRRLSCRGLRSNR